MAPEVVDRARPALATLAEAAQARPASLVGIISGLGAAVAGYVVVAVLATLVWLGNGGGSWGALGPFTALAWAASHGLPVTIAGTTITLVPWGWVIVPVTALVLVHRHARRTADLRTLRDAAVLIVATALAYGICVGIAAVIADGTGANVLVRRALWQSAAIAVVVLAVTSPIVRTAVPARVRAMIRGGVLALLGMAGIAALLVAVLLLVHLPDAMDLARALGGGILGGLGLLLLQLGYLPIVVVWAMAFMTGAPVELSADGRLSAFLPVAPQAELPALPLLAAIPQSVSPLAWALPALVVLVGALLGASCTRNRGEQDRDEQGVDEQGGDRHGRALLARIGGSVGIAGVLVAVACLLATGSVGTQRLAGLGPAWAIAGLATIVLLAVGALPTAFVLARAKTPASAAPTLEVIP